MLGMYRGFGVGRATGTPGLATGKSGLTLAFDAIAARDLEPPARAAFLVQRRRQPECLVEGA